VSGSEMIDWGINPPSVVIDESGEVDFDSAVEVCPPHVVTFAIEEGRAYWTCSCHAYMEESVSIDNFQIAQATALDHLEDAGAVKQHKAVDYHRVHAPKAAQAVGE
jgi:hypothetical protein